MRAIFAPVLKHSLFLLLVCCFANSHGDTPSGYLGKRWLAGFHVEMPALTATPGFQLHVERVMEQKGGLLLGYSSYQTPVFDNPYALFNVGSELSHESTIYFSDDPNAYNRYVFVMDQHRITTRTFLLQFQYYFGMAPTQYYFGLVSGWRSSSSGNKQTYSLLLDDKDWSPRFNPDVHRDPLSTLSEQRYYDIDAPGRFGSFLLGWESGYAMVLWDRFRLSYSARYTLSFSRSRIGWHYLLNTDDKYVSSRGDLAIYREHERLQLLARNLLTLNVGLSYMF
jgi:hypothetical protein